MIRHTVLFGWKPEATEEQKQQVAAEAGFFAYRDDPGHRDIVQRYILPITAQRAAVQYEV